jgi:TetR/AcrR family transcriptional repressor of nem operon
VAISSRDQAKQETREALLRAALALIPERGLDVSLDDICDRAGYTRGAFYVHFADRDALIAAVMERVGRSVLDALIGATGQGDELASVVARFLRGLSTGAYPLTRAGGVRPYQLLDACARSPAVREQYVTLVREAVKRLGESLGAGQQQGTVRDDVRPEDLGMLLVTIAIGVHTLVDLDVKLDLGRAATSLMGLWRPTPVAPVRTKRARARPARRRPRT